MTSRSSEPVEVDLLRWEKARNWLVVVLAGGGGAVVTALAVIGATGGDLQRLQGLVLGVPLLVLGATSLRIVLRRRLVLVLDTDGLTVRQQPDGGFSVPWRDLARVRITREPFRVRLITVWSYALDLHPAGRRLARDLDYLREGDIYRYPLGYIGPAARRARQALSETRPDLWRD